MSTRAARGKDGAARPPRTVVVRGRPGALGVLVAGVLALSACGGASESCGQTAPGESPAMDLVSPDDRGPLGCRIDGGGADPSTRGHSETSSPDWGKRAGDRPSLEPHARTGGKRQTVSRPWPAPSRASPRWTPEPRAGDPWHAESDTVPGR